MTESTKVCRNCGETKPLEAEFHRSAKARDGHVGECKSCACERVAQWRARPGKREKVREYMRQRYTENREELLERGREQRNIRMAPILASRASERAAEREVLRNRSGKVCAKCGELKPMAAYHKNKAAVDLRNRICMPCNREHANQWRENNLERSRKSSRAWYHRNDETWMTSRAADFRGRSRAAGWTPVVVPFTREQIRDKSDGTCSVTGCGTSDSLELDHIWPVSLAGPHTLENCQLLCYYHHRKKSGMDLRMFVAYRNHGRINA